MEPEEIVEAGYDALAERYRAWTGEISDDPRTRFLDDLMARLPTNPTVLDLGCGNGFPSTAQLAERGEVTGVDISAKQLELARGNVPRARFVKGSMMTVGFPAASFDAVTALYSVLHLPPTRHAALFQRIAAWLRPGGHFLAALGCDNSDDTGDWLGRPMYFGSHDAPTNRRLVEAAGLTAIIDEMVTIAEPEGPATFHWVLAARPWS